MDLHSFTLEGKPVPASRPKVTKWGTYYPKNHTARANYLNGVLPGLLDQSKTISEPVEVRILSVMPRYQTSDYPVSRADVDNLSKLPMDCMTKCQFWDDDNLVVSLVSMKRFVRDGEEPHTKVRVIRINGSVEDHVDRLFES